jgi:3-oxoacyl-[acyl-carrier protein] reductase
MPAEPARWARIGDLVEGQTASCRARVSADLIRACAEFSGDFNPVHCDTAAALELGQSRPVAHGLVSMGLISRLIGMDLPGPGAVWFQQEIEFLAPVREGDEIEARVTVTHVSAATNVVVMAVEVTRLPETLTLRGKVKVRMPSTFAQVRRTMELKEQVAIVTGGGRGLGRAIAVALGRHGVRVVANYRTDAASAAETVAEIQSLGGEAIAERADVADPEGARRLFEAATRGFGKVDVIVHNATPPIIQRPLLETTPEELTRFFDTYAIGALELARLAVPGMRERKFGRIVNVLTSILGEVSPGMGAYICGKSALHGLSRAMAVEFGPWGITVNTIAPSMLIGDRTDDLGLAARELVARRTPLRRLATVEEVADVVLFLIGDGGSFVSGANLPITGGILI